MMPAVMSSTFDLEGIVALEPDLVLLPDSAMATHGEYGNAQLLQRCV